MSVTRIYQPVPLTLQASIRLDERASHHLGRVLRGSPGDAVVLFNGDGSEYQGQISAVDKKGVTVQILSHSTPAVESPIEIHLAQGIARGEKMDFIVQKAVELGVKCISPLITERCNVKLVGEREEKRLQHWQGVAISACEQSGRTIVPTISAPQTLRSWLANAQAERSFVLSPHVKNKLPAEKMNPGSRIILLIGPEGGLSEVEVNKALAQGFLALNLGPRILRTETATLAAITTLQCLFGDLV